jgi:tetratricopeptide (TPR) repeat protein
MSKVARIVLIAVAIGGAAVAGCGSTQQRTTTGSDHTSHASRDDADDSSDDSGDSELTSPPGSREPEPEEETSTPTSTEPTTTASTTPTTSSSSSSSSSTPTESPWGQSEAETGAPLPPRHPMSASASDAYRRGLDLAARGDTAGATQAFQQALAADSNAFRAEYNLGVLEDRVGHADQAITHYRAALRIQPDYELALDGIVAIRVRQGRASEAVTFVEPIARQYVRNLAVQAIYGEALVHANRAQDAITAARAALRRDERFVPAMIVLIKANIALHRTELASSILDQALAVDANNAELHFLRGRFQQDAGQLAVALTEYRRAVELRPDYADARMALGLHLLAGANYDDAVQQFDAVSHLLPNEPAVHLNLGDAYRATKQYEKAQTEFARVLELQPGNCQVHYDIGLMYMAQAVDLTGADQLAMLQRSQSDMASYRTCMGPALARDDASTQYMEELTRQIDRVQRLIERDRARQERERARAAREAEESGSSTDGATTPTP